MSIRTVAPALVIAACACTAAASAQAVPLLSPLKAPARVALDVDGGAVSNQSIGGGASIAVALPDGGTLLAGHSGDQPYRLLIERIDRAGAPVTSFGSGGVVTLDLAAQKVNVVQILRRADGRLLLVGDGAPAAAQSFPQIVLARLQADGSLDTSFGSAGFAATGIGAGCAEQCTTAAFDTAGRIVFTGTTGQINPLPAPGDYSGLRWVVARRTADGAPDGAFGAGGAVTLPLPGGSGWNVAVLPDNRVVAEAQVGLKPGATSMTLARLLPSGAPDPAFAGGATVTTPIASGFPLLAGADGQVAIAGLQSTANASSHQLIARYAADGTQQSVTDVGVTNISQLLPGVGALVAVHQDNGKLSVSLGGAPALSLPTTFGGGVSSILVSKQPRPLPSLSQNSFGGSRLVPRVDGSYLIPGGVSVTQPTGEGEGHALFRFAAVSLRSDFTADTAFGGPAAAPKLSASFASQRRSTARSRRGIRVRLRSSAPGLARVTVRAAGRVVAQSVVPVFKVDRTATLPVELTKAGVKLLGSSSRRLQVSMSVSLRDVLATPKSAKADGALR